MIDEIFKGTNNRERLLGSQAYIEALLKQPALGGVTTHDLELVVEVCPRVLVMDGGVIVAQGPAHELLNNEDLMLRHGLERPHSLRHHHPH